MNIDVHVQNLDITILVRPLIKKSPEMLHDTKNPTYNQQQYSVLKATLDTI